MSAVSRVCGRLAPSPTGYIHLGNAWAFLLAWLAARSAGGEIVLRLEDIDPQRAHPKYSAAILEDLRWLGLDWDRGPDANSGNHVGPYVQSQRGHIYTAALKRLEDAGLTYPCFCTRKELRTLAAAPHADDAGLPYPGLCRSLRPAHAATLLAQGRRACLRLRCPDTPIDFTDAVLGPQRFLMAHCGGDFALRRSDGVVAYQLAVAVDDALMGINQVVRGRDILTSTPRQIALLDLLGYEAPSYAHVPLLLDAEGQRLAKRHQSLTLRALREMGVDQRRVTGLLGRLAGIHPEGGAVSPAELVPAFAPACLPQQDIRITEDDFRSLAA